MTTQQVEGRGTVPAHTHDVRVHTHDHYHVSHHHKGGVMGEFEHRTYWHTHDHNHNELAHSHDYSVEDEEQEHGKEAHIHDHAAPASMPERAETVGEMVEVGAGANGGGVSRRLG
jgi:hypothetical protein